MTDIAAHISTPIAPDLLHGIGNAEFASGGVSLHRLPAWARAQCPDPQLILAEGQPSGGRLAFTTTATTIELDTRPTKRLYSGLPPRPDGIYDLCDDGEVVRQATAQGGNTLEIDTTTWRHRLVEGGPATIRFDDLPPGSKTVEIWLPHDETTELLGLRSDAPLEPLVNSKRRVWVHHGSSISQGSNATSPTGIWPAIAARRAAVSLTNFGFGGSALLDPFVARAIRDTPADAISIKIGINLVNLDLMRLRAFAPAVHGFLDTIRDGHPTTPLLVVSPIFCPIHEDTPGPAIADFTSGQPHFRATGNPAEVAAGKLTLTVIRDVLQRIVTQRQGVDPAIHYLDGRDLYGADDNATLPLPDGLHPDAATHRLIGERFATAALARLVG
jgi:lysophospholipase L1-like esterase